MAWQSVISIIDKLYVKQQMFSFTNHKHSNKENKLLNILNKRPMIIISDVEKLQLQKKKEEKQTRKTS